MVIYSCVIPSCISSQVVTTDRKAIFRHYLTHLLSDIENTADRIGILISNENRYSLINALIEFSKRTVNNV